MVGDRWRDIGAGQNAACKTIWIDRAIEKKPDPPADFTAYSLRKPTEWILGINVIINLMNLTIVLMKSHFLFKETPSN